jgi:hypothetical protein
MKKKTLAFVLAGIMFACWRPRHLRNAAIIRSIPITRTTPCIRCKTRIVDQQKPPSQGGGFSLNLDAFDVSTGTLIIRVLWKSYCGIPSRCFVFSSFSSWVACWAGEGAVAPASSWEHHRRSRGSRSASALFSRVARPSPAEAARPLSRARCGAGRFSGDYQWPVLGDR